MKKDLKEIQALLFRYQTQILARDKSNPVFLLNYAINQLDLLIQKRTRKGRIA